MARLYLYVMSVVFFLVALQGWFLPTSLMNPIGVTMPEAAGLAEIRAAYGGLFGTASLCFLVGARRPRLRSISIAVSVCILSGFVFGRLFSLAVDGVPSTFGLTWLTIESVGLAVGGTLLRIGGVPWRDSGEAC